MPKAQLNALQIEAMQDPPFRARFLDSESARARLNALQQLSGVLVERVEYAQKHNAECSDAQSTAFREQARATIALYIEHFERPLGPISCSDADMIFYVAALMSAYFAGVALNQHISPLEQRIIGQQSMSTFKALGILL